MRRSCKFIFLFLLLAAAVSVSAATGKIAKVLPQFLDLQGRTSLSPSLYDRDAYQAKLRAKPDLCSGIRFKILWRGRSAAREKATLRVEMRGTAKGNLPSEAKLETIVEITGTGHWAELKLDGENYKNLGDITAWRVTLWTGETMIGEQKSFLW